jgi:hypothetical protein
MELCQVGLLSPLTGKQLDALMLHFDAFDWALKLCAESL